jgi:hypothetical protein
MNNLFVFGDSFSAGHGVRFTPYLSYINSEKLDYEVAFVDRIATELNLRLHNFARGGISNTAILKLFFQNYSKIKKDDVVIIQSTFWNRLTFTHKLKNAEFHSTGPGSMDKRINDPDFEEICDKYLVLYHSREIAMIDTFSAYSLIAEFCDLKGIKVFFWSLDEISTECYSKFEQIIKERFLIPIEPELYLSWFSPAVDKLKLSIKHECDLDDLHLSIKGNDYFYDNMISQIKNKLENYNEFILKNNLL